MPLEHPPFIRFPIAREHLSPLDRSEVFETYAVLFPIEMGIVVEFRGDEYARHLGRFPRTADEAILDPVMSQPAWITGRSHSERDRIVPRSPQAREKERLK